MSGLITFEKKGDFSKTFKFFNRLLNREYLNVLEKYGVILHTIGVYSVNTKDEKIKEMRKDIKKIVFSYNGILEMHGFYVDEKEKTISFDIIIDFEVENREDIYKKIYDEVKNKYKDYKLYITLDVDISD